ncbi:unnamed protein product [Echinostoma caproni]|uniref:DUF58 domain-containing protein n=1 Tax=Echinostoma caproni TaxID=27848 RepID=A0A183ARQ8_9TREM|nr:unnamed protein product [Echinostoma caproni]
MYNHVKDTTRFGSGYQPSTLDLILTIAELVGRDRRVAQMPLILCVDSRSDENNITLVGIPPLHGDDDRNLFGQAFEAAVRKTKARAEFRNCIELHREDMLKLFEALSALLS